MTDLKKQNVDKCFALLREFIDEVDSRKGKKGSAILALDQLQRISAGEKGRAPLCLGRPRSDSGPGLELGCVGRPRVDGTPSL